jgi:uncharacterized protein YciW
MARTKSVLTWREHAILLRMKERLGAEAETAMIELGWDDARRAMAKEEFVKYARRAVAKVMNDRCEAERATCHPPWRERTPTVSPRKHRQKAERDAKRAAKKAERDAKKAAKKEAQ